MTGILQLRIFDAGQRQDGEGWSKGVLWLVLGGVISTVIIGAGVMIDRSSAQYEQQRVEHEVADALRHAQVSIRNRLNLDVANALAIADDIADDPMLSPTELNRTINKIVSRDPHITTVAFVPLNDIHRMAFQPKLSLAHNTVELSIPVPPPSWEATKAWKLMTVSLDITKIFDAAGLSDLSAADGSASPADLDHGLDRLHLAIATAGPDGRMLFGTASIHDEQPIAQEFSHHDLSFVLYGAPAEGWDAAMSRLMPTRMIVLSTVAAMMVPVLLALFLLRERNRNISQLQGREERLIDLSHRFQLAMETSNIGIWDIDEETHGLHWDERSAGLHGLPVSQTDNEDRLADWYATIHPDDVQKAEQQFFDCVIACTETVWDVTYRIELSDGTCRYLRSAGASSINERGKRRLTGIVCDVTTDTLVTQSLSQAKETSDIKNAELELALDELSSREHQLAELSHRLDLALASYNCGIWEGDPVSRTAVWDERMHQLYGLPYSEQPVTEHQWMACLHPDERGDILITTKRATTNEQTLNTIQRVILPNNEVRYIRSVGQAHFGRDGKKKLIGIAFDVTADSLLAEQLRSAKAEADMRNIELELAKNRIEFNALHDPLTSLANRRKLDLELDTLTRKGESQRHKFAILHLDLDRFKEINDTLGHAAGDAMLVHASRVLMRHVPRGDLVARIGGDEFVILARRATTMDELTDLANRIITEMRHPIDFEGFDCRCGVSIGIAQSVGMAPDARKVLINADIALYQAKEKGRNCYEFFTPDLQANIIAKKRMADDMLTGLERDEFIVWYQPQFETNSMQLCGAEALVRWRHPDRGVLASGAFLKVAEDLNVMARIDQLVLQTALKDQMRWTALGVQVPRISVNVSSKRLHDENLIEQLEGLNVPQGSICFELVESIFLDESDTIATSNIDRIKALGIDIEIDDFGTGHTSIVSLLKLKPKRLKIDRQLVMPITTQPQERSLVRSIVEIAGSLGIETVAEGVETHEHAALLRQLGCDYLQGYAFAKPLSFEDFSRFVTRLPQRQAS